jgi:hypothetical protein
MIHPLFRIAWELWHEYDKTGVAWKTDKAWTAAVAKIAGGKVTRDGQTYGTMDRDNPDWQSVVMVKGFGSDGVTPTWSLSHTRQTRDAAYQHLASIAGLTTAAPKATPSGPAGALVPAVAAQPAASAAQAPATATSGK